MNKITLGSGCFWCVEAVFKSLNGVKSVLPGYSGGGISNPTYKEVCSGLTGHAEVVQLEYDENEISLKDILEVFFQTHDPTSINRQGADIGTQYRSAIFYHNDAQKAIAEEVINALNSSGAFENKIVTQVTPFDTFYVAEEYHHDYFARNPEQAYCQAVVRPKVEKFKKVFAERLKTA
tara:strand:- start:6352 stop:6885 length:534 start_codon:yes stop_codon:yes gene_type:complete